MNRFFSGSCPYLQIKVMRQIKGAWYYREAADKKPRIWGCLWPISKPYPYWFSQIQGINAQVQESIKSEAHIGCTELCVFLEGYSKSVFQKIISLYLRMKFAIQASRMQCWFQSGNKVLLIFFFSSFEHCSYSNHFPGSTQVSILFCLNSCLVN